MSSDEETDVQPGSKKRRIPRACDSCRKKKTKCDSAVKPGNICSNCIAFNIECLHTMPIKKRGPQKKYVEDLEQRVNKLETLLRKFNPSVDITNEISNNGSESPKPTDASSYVSPLSVLPTVSSATSPSDVESDEENELPKDSHDSTDFMHLTITEQLQNLQVHTTTESKRFFGKSSGFMLVSNALNLKEQHIDMEQATARIRSARREKFWRLEPWEMNSFYADEHVNFQFPDFDLVASLIGLYFKHINASIPILHRPTFEKSVFEGLHLRNHFFGATLLLVCSLGSRYSDDPRTIPEGCQDRLAAGYHWFDQISWLRKSLFVPPSLYEVQMYALAAVYMLCTSSPQATWTLLGIGCRFCQELGLHRKNGHETTVSEHQWRRVFWVLVTLDRLVASFVGRSTSLQSEDIDVDLPIEVDDEFWDTGDSLTSYKQPPSKPSTMAFFPCYIRLTEILAFALRNLYCTNKYLVLAGHTGPQWEQHIVSTLDSELNKWFDTIPEHLKWDPTMPDYLFFHQSSVLHCIYYHVQIQIHRPFITKTSPLAFASLAICTNAARSCARILAMQFRRDQLVATPQMIIVAFTAGVVLMMNIWSGKSTGLVLDPVREMKDVQSCLDYLAHCEKTWHMPGRFWDLLHELAEMSDAVVSSVPAPTSKKRGRDDDLESPTQAMSVVPGTAAYSGVPKTAPLPARVPVPRTEPALEAMWDICAAQDTPAASTSASNSSTPRGLNVLGGLTTMSGVDPRGATSTTAGFDMSNMHPMLRDGATRSNGDFTFNDFLLFAENSPELGDLFRTTNPVASTSLQTSFNQPGGLGDSADALSQQWVSNWASAPMTWGSDEWADYLLQCNTADITVQQADVKSAQQLL